MSPETVYGPSGLLSIDGTKERLGVSRRTVLREIAAGELVAVRIGRRTLIDPRDLEAYIERHKGG